MKIKTKTKVIIELEFEEAAALHNYLAMKEGNQSYCSTEHQRKLIPELIKKLWNLNRPGEE